MANSDIARHATTTTATNACGKCNCVYIFSYYAMYTFLDFNLNQTNCSSEPARTFQMLNIIIKRCVYVCDSVSLSHAYNSLPNITFTNCIIHRNNERKRLSSPPLVVGAGADSVIALLLPLLGYAVFAQITGINTVMYALHITYYISK